MIYNSAQQPNQLPTISQVLDMVKDLVGKMPVRHRMPYDEEFGGDDVFLLNRTASGLFTMKPNITTKPCLFLGVNSFQPMLQPVWNTLERKDYIVENVLREEFELTMESHPLYRLFLHGIPTSRQLVRVVNPYGNAMAYGFPSPMLPLSSSLDIATFFATHKQEKLPIFYDYLRIISIFAKLLFVTIL